MNPAMKGAMAQQLMAQPQIPPQPQGPPPGAAPTGGEMSPEQAQQVLGQLGIGPEQLPVVAQAIQTIVMAQQGGGGAPPPQAGMPPA